MISACGLGKAMGEEEFERPPVGLNLVETLEIARRGVRRASAFMAVGLQALAHDSLVSATLPSSMRYGFLPDPLPDALAAAVADEYSAWLVGNGLRELDQYFGLFADRVWWTICAGELHGKIVASDHVIGGKFHANTNVSRKIAQIVERIGDAGIHSEYFDGFSRARNSLGHAAGQVRERDTIDGGGLTLRWLALQTMLSQNGIEVPFLGESPSAEIPDPGGDEVSIIAKITERTKTFSVGEQIRLSPFDLSEICFFYNQQAVTLVTHLKSWPLAQGIPEASDADPGCSEKGGPVSEAAPNLTAKSLNLTPRRFPPWPTGLHPSPGRRPSSTTWSCRDRRSRGA